MNSIKNKFDIKTIVCSLNFPFWNDPFIQLTESMYNSYIKQVQYSTIFCAKNWLIVERAVLYILPGHSSWVESLPSSPQTHSQTIRPSLYNLIETNFHYSVFSIILRFNLIN